MVADVSHREVCHTDGVCVCRPKFSPVGVLLSGFSRACGAFDLHLHYIYKRTSTHTRTHTHTHTHTHTRGRDDGTLLAHDARSMQQGLDAVWMGGWSSGQKLGVNDKGTETAIAGAAATYTGWLLPPFHNCANRTFANPPSVHAGSWGAANSLSLLCRYPGA